MSDLLARARAYGVKRKRRVGLAGGTLAILLALALAGVLFSHAATSTQSVVAQGPPAQRNQQPKQQGVLAPVMSFSHESYFSHERALAGMALNNRRALAAPAASQSFLLWEDSLVAIRAQEFSHLGGTLLLNTASRAGAKRRLVSCAYGESVGVSVYGNAGTKRKLVLEDSLLLPLIPSASGRSIPTSQSGPRARLATQPIYLVYAKPLMALKHRLIVVLETSPEVRGIRVAWLNTHTRSKAGLEAPSVHGLTALVTQLPQSHEDELLIQALGKSQHIIATVTLSPAVAILADPNCQ